MSDDLWIGEAESGAVFSPCGKYRWVLWRTFNPIIPMEERRYANLLMLNGSTADEKKNDPTVERGVRRARGWGYDGLIVTNLFGFRATDPKVMLAASDPVGPENDKWIVSIAKRSALVVCGWGGDGRFKGRGVKVVGMLREAGVKLHYLKMSDGTGQPWHPLYIGYHEHPKEWAE